MRIATGCFAVIWIALGLSGCESKEAEGVLEGAPTQEVVKHKTDWGEKVADTSKLLKSKYWAKSTSGLVYTIEITKNTAKFEYSGEHGNSVSVCKLSLHKVSEDTYNLALKKCTGVTFEKCGGIELTLTDGWNAALVTDYFMGVKGDGSDRPSGSCAELAELSASPLGSPPKQVPSATEPPSVNVETGGKACTAYVECVCDLSDALNGKAGMAAPADCAEMKRLYGVLGSMNNNKSICERMLKGLKEFFQANTALYEMNNIAIPSSCGGSGALRVQKLRVQKVNGPPGGF